jgi:hypothetical protein
MSFQLVLADGVERIEFGDRASYSFNQAGFLVVIQDDGMRLTYTHSAWHHLEDTPRGGW